MQRRKFIAGVGSLAAAGAAGIGTGAFSSMSASRDADVDVVTDSNGLIALNAGAGADGRVSEVDGELGIDFTSSEGGQGVNVDSRYQVGVFDDKSWAVPDGALEVASSGTAALEIVNQDSANHTVDIGYECDANDIGNATIYFQFWHDHDTGITHHTIGGRSGNRKISGTDTEAYLSDEGQEIPKSGDPFAPGDTIGGVVLVDTRDVSMAPSDLDLSGTLTVLAE